MLNKHSSELDQQKTHLDLLLTESEAWKITNQINIILKYSSTVLPAGQIARIRTSTTVKALKEELDKYSLELNKEHDPLHTNKEAIFINLMTDVSKITQVHLDSEALLEKLRKEI